jgi:hypothetical protein
MHKSATKCNETLNKWCKNKHGASKIIDTLETYQNARFEFCYILQNQIEFKTKLKQVVIVVRRCRLCARCKPGDGFCLTGRIGSVPPLGLVQFGFQWARCQSNSV